MERWEVLSKIERTDEEMILSNWHVLAGAGYTPKGLKNFVSLAMPMAPKPKTLLPRLETARYEIMALTLPWQKLTGTRSWRNDQLDLGPVSGVTSPTLGMRVQKSGRSSEVTDGVITGIEGVRTDPLWWV